MVRKAQKTTKSAIRGQAESPCLPADSILLYELSQLNLSWLHSYVQGRHDAVSVLLAALAPPQQAIIAASPFALFHLPDPVAECVADVQDDAPHRCGLRKNELALTVGLFAFAWHLVQIDARAARLLLGLGPRLCQRLMVSPLARLQTAVGGLQRLPAASLQGSPLYWQELVHAVSAGCEARVRTIQLRGLQLLAAEAQSLT